MKATQPHNPQPYKRHKVRLDNYDVEFLLEAVDLNEQIEKRITVYQY